MGKNAPGRVALMSIRPEFANAILSGEKVVEFRKRPVADDVSHVLIYATMPVGSLLGWFTVRGQTTMSAKGLWSTFRAVGGISKSRFFEYYDQRERGTGILVETAGRYPEPVPLSELGTTLRPPNSGNPRKTRKRTSAMYCPPLARDVVVLMICVPLEFEPIDTRQGWR